MPVIEEVFDEVCLNKSEDEKKDNQVNAENDTHLKNNPINKTKNLTPLEIINIIKDTGNFKSLSVNDKIHYLNLLFGWITCEDQRQISLCAIEGIPQIILDYILTSCLYSEKQFLEKNKKDYDFGNQLFLEAHLCRLLSCFTNSVTDELSEKYKIQLEVEKPVEEDADILQAKKSLSIDWKQVKDKMEYYARGNLLNTPKKLSNVYEEKKCEDKDPTNGINSSHSLSAASHRTLCLMFLEEFCASLEDWDNVQFIDCLTIGCNALSDSVKSRALSAIVRTLDCRRRYGTNITALKYSQSLLSLTESVLQLSDNVTDVVKEDAKNDQIRLGNSVKSAMMMIFLLLIKDKQRSKEDEVNSKSIINLLLQPYFDSDKADSWEIGLRGLKYLWMADRTECKEIILMSSMCHIIMVYASSYHPDNPSLQATAADLLISLLEAQECREVLLADGILDILAGLVIKTSTALTLKAKILSGMSRLSLHNEETRNEVFKNFEFFDLAKTVLSEVKNLEEATMSDEMTRNMLEVVFFLSIHSAFKAQLIMSISKDVSKKSFVKVSDTDAMINAPILLQSLPKLGAASVKSNDKVSQFLFVGIISNLTRSSEDKDKIRRVPGMPMWDDEQLEQVELLMENMPKEGKPAPNGDFDRGDNSLVREMCTSLIESECFKYCCNILRKDTDISANLASQSGRAIYQVIFKGDESTRGQMIKWGAFKAMMNVVSVLSRDKQWIRSAADDMKDMRHALARLAMGVNPASLSYSEKLNIIPHMLALLEASHELMNYEGFLVLTNLAAVCSDSRERMLSEGGFNQVSSATMVDNMKVRQAGIELMANLTQSDTLLKEIANGRWTVEMNFLFLCMAEYEYQGIMHAAAGALAMASNDIMVGLHLLYNCDKCCSALIEAVMSVVASKDLAMGARVKVLWSNILESACCGYDLNGIKITSTEQTNCLNGWKELQKIATTVIEFACTKPEEFADNDMAMEGMRQVKLGFENFLKLGKNVFQ